MTFARAAVERSEQAARLTAQAALAVNLMDDDEAKAIWSSHQEERIAAAEAIATTLSGEPLRRQRRRIASLRRNLALGPVGLSAAAVKAVRARQMGGYPPTQGRRHRGRVGDRNG